MKMTFKVKLHSHKGLKATKALRLPLPQNPKTRKMISIWMWQLLNLHYRTLPQSLLKALSDSQATPRNISI